MMMQYVMELGGKLTGVLAIISDGLGEEPAPPREIALAQ
jgi:hypothetical protein